MTKRPRDHQSGPRHSASEGTNLPSRQGLPSPDVADQFVAELATDLQDETFPPEAINNLIKRVNRTAFGFRSFRNHRVRSLLYAGRPNWDLLATITPR
jgi:hypothetical protein